MHIYSNLVFLGISGVVLLAFSAFQILTPLISFGLAVLAYLIFLSIAFFNTRTWLDKEYEKKITLMKKKYETRISRLKNEHDLATLEKTIRNGTKTLIKNAVDYFKIENIKNEMPPSAAIQNLQLDKYGQIIELLADFSLILPDYEENRQIVMQEINHQIEIFQIDERAFAEFLQSVLGKYQLTVKKKIREKMRQNSLREMKTCPQCFERIPVNARICRHCAHGLTVISESHSLKPTREKEWVKKGHAYVKKGKMEEALDAFSRAININPQSAVSYLARGMIYKKMNKIQSAVSDLKAASGLGHEKAREMLVQIMNDKTQEMNVSSFKEAEKKKSASGPVHAEARFTDGNGKEEIPLEKKPWKTGAENASVQTGAAGTTVTNLAEVKKKAASVGSEGWKDGEVHIMTVPPKTPAVPKDAEAETKSEKVSDQKKDTSEPNRSEEFPKSAVPEKKTP